MTMLFFTVYPAFLKLRPYAARQLHLLLFVEYIR